MNTIQRFPIFALALLAACQNRDAADNAARDTNSTATQAAPTVTAADSSNPIMRATYAPALNVDLSAMRRTPMGAYIRDLAPGSGPEADSGSTVSIHYRGTFTDGRQFDANQAPQTPFTFRVKNGEVVAGFDEGVMGMKAGGRRQVIIPSELGYGPNDYGPIPGGSILVFTIEMTRVQ